MREMTAAEALIVVKGAKLPSDLFDKNTDLARHQYRTFSRLLHPDAGGDTEAFAKMSALWDEYRNPTPAKTLVFSSRRNTFNVGPLVAKGDVANLYLARYLVSDAEQLAVAKMPRNPADSDLMVREVTALKALADLKDYPAALVDTVRHKDPTTGKQRRVNFLRHLEGWYSLSAVALAYPNGLHPKDIAWLWRRVLINLAVTHEAKVIHGAVLPSHVMIKPGNHDVVLVDWCYSSTDGQPVPAIVNGFKAWYPPEVLSKGTPTPATDVYMAAKTVGSLIGSLGAAAERRRFLAFFNGCTFAQASDAWVLLREFDDLIENMWGERKFHPFTMPA